MMNLPRMLELKIEVHQFLVKRSLGFKGFLPPIQDVLMALSKLYSVVFLRSGPPLNESTVSALFAESASVRC